LKNLLPPQCKFAGIVVVVSGATLGYLCFVGHVEISWLRGPVFALISWFTRPRFLVISQTNLTNELALSLMLIGLCLIIFSREKNECREIAQLRHRSMFYASLAQLAYYGVCIWFMFGLGFIIAAALGIVFLFVFHLAIFNYLLLRHGKGRKTGSCGKTAE
jgi:hypothetical protein